MNDEVSLRQMRVRKAISEALQQRRIPPPVFDVIVSVFGKGYEEGFKQFVAAQPERSHAELAADILVSYDEIMSERA